MGKMNAIGMANMPISSAFTMAFALNFSGGNVHLRRFEIGFNLSFFELVELHVFCEKIRKVSEPYIQR